MIEHEPTIIQCLESNRREWMSCLRQADQVPADPQPTDKGQEQGQDAPMNETGQNRAGTIKIQRIRP